MDRLASLTHNSVLLLPSWMNARSFSTPPRFTVPPPVNSVHVALAGVDQLMALDPLAKQPPTISSSMTIVAPVGALPLRIYIPAIIVLPDCKIGSGSL